MTDMPVRAVCVSWAPCLWEGHAENESALSHSPSPLHRGATPRNFRVLPRRIVLIRHAESQGNLDDACYTYLPDNRIPLTAKGWEQARAAGQRLREVTGGEGTIFFYTSPYLRGKQTCEGVASAFAPESILGIQEEVQLREQDFGNFQDLAGKAREKEERLRFGRFFYRFPNGESGADVYDRMTIFEDHLVRDINAGRFGRDCTLVLVTHGLALRIFLMRWFHWTVDEFMGVFNPPNAEPLVLERAAARDARGAAWVHTKALYRLNAQSRAIVRGCSDEMCAVSTHAETREPGPLEFLFGSCRERGAGGAGALERERADAAAALAQQQEASTALRPKQVPGGGWDVTGQD